MSSVQVSKLDAPTKNQLILSYAALLLASSDVAVSEENLKKVVEASGNKADANLVRAYGKILQGKDLKKYYASAAPAEVHHEEKKPEAKKEAPKKEEKKKEG